MLGHVSVRSTVSAPIHTGVCGDLSQPTAVFISILYRCFQLLIHGFIASDNHVATFSLFSVTHLMLALVFSML